MSFFRIFIASLLLQIVSIAASQTPSVVIRSGAITLKVPNFGEARTEAMAIAEKNGGHVIGGQGRVTEKGKSHGWLRVIVPIDRLDSSMQELRGIGSVFGDSLTEHNQSEEVEELASRTVRLQQHQERLSALLQSSRKLRGSDILFVQDRLLRAGLDQDQLGHRREQILRSATVGDISVILFEPGSISHPPPTLVTFGDKTAFAFASAWKSFSKFIEHIGLLVAELAVYGLLWIPVFFLVWSLWRKFRARQRRRFDVSP